MTTTRSARALLAASLGAGLLAAGAPVPAQVAPPAAPPATAPAAAPAAADGAAYANPLALRLASGETAQNCADPGVLRDPRARAPTWYLYCSSDPVSKRERDRGGWHTRLIPTYRSSDLVHWDFVTDAFAERPPGLAAPTASLRGPDPAYADGRYLLYFSVSDAADEHSPVRGCRRDGAIGVATADGPAGPWTTQAQPVVAPRQTGPGCDFQPVFDPKLVVDKGQKYLVYGGKGGGVWVQRLRADGLAGLGGQKRLGADGPFEGAEMVRRDDWWYLFVTAAPADAGAGATAGATVLVGRARTPNGPFLDKAGRDLAAGGGSAFLAGDGKRWRIGGHNALVEDAAGGWWTLYHATDANEPDFSAPDGLARRLPLLARVDWIEGWPAAAAPDDGRHPAPAAR